MTVLQQITFDERSQIRIFPVTEAEKSLKLLDESKQFPRELDQVRAALEQVVSVLKSKEEQIEREKLDAISRRSQLATLAEKQKASQREVAALLREREAELARVQVEAESLQRIVNEQEALIDTLSN